LLSLDRLTGLVGQYPLYSKAAEALWLEGDSYGRMGPRFRPQTGEAYTKIVRDYPLSQYADGRVHTPSLPAADGRDMPDAPSYAESFYTQLELGWAPLYGWRTAKYKFIDAPHAELYDLEQDASEKTNLIAQQGALADQMRRGLQSGVDVGDFLRLHQTQVTIRQGEASVFGQMSEISDSAGNALRQHRRVARSGDPIGDHASELDVAAISSQTVSEGAESLRHGCRVDHSEDRQPETGCQIGAARLAVEQTHHAFDQDHVRNASGLVEQLTALRFAHHPQVELVHRSARGLLQDHRVEKIRPHLEHTAMQPATAEVARQASRDGGLALTGGRRAHQQEHADPGCRN
jgi:hypothetical protein